MRILHVTEAFGGGIVTVLTSLASDQVAAGDDVAIWFMPRPGAPIDPAELGIHPDVELRRLERTGRRLRDLGLIFRLVREALRSGEWDVVHLHSAFAGVLGRLSYRRHAVGDARLFYSPHGFPFLMLDRSRLARGVFRWIERRFARRCDGVIVTWDSEGEVARAELGVEPIGVLHTGLPPAQIEEFRALPRPQHARPRVGMIGRVAFQKAPWRFRDVARAVDGADFVWIGGGPDADVRRWLEGIPLTGWLSPSELTREIQDLDLLVFPSLWEGFPLSLAQAQAMGVPAVASDVVGNRDIVIDGVTGRLCADDAELVAAVRAAVADPGLIREWSAQAVALAGRLSSVRVAAEADAAYRAGGASD